MNIDDKGTLMTKAQPGKPTVCIPRKVFMVGNLTVGGLTCYNKELMPSSGNTFEHWKDQLGSLALKYVCRYYHQSNVVVLPFLYYL